MRRGARGQYDDTRIHSINWDRSILIIFIRPLSCDYFYNVLTPLTILRDARSSIFIFSVIFLSIFTRKVLKIDMEFFELIFVMENSGTAGFWGVLDFFINIFKIFFLYLPFGCPWPWRDGNGNVRHPLWCNTRNCRLWRLGYLSRLAEASISPSKSDGIMAPLRFSCKLICNPKQREGSPIIPIVNVAQSRFFSASEIFTKIIKFSLKLYIQIFQSIFKFKFFLN